MFNVKEKGLTGFDLKYLAVVFMVLDHIHYFFEFTGKVPLAFSWIGRLAAPLFLFCFVEGFIHTHNRKAYFLKIYLISVAMGAIQFGFFNVLSPLVRPDGFYPQNAMLSTFAILFVVMQGIDWIKQKKFVIGFMAVIIPLILPTLVNYFVFKPDMSGAGQIQGLIANILGYTVLPMHSWIIDGGTLTVLEGMILLIFSYCANKKIRIYAWAIFVILWDAMMFRLSGFPINIDTVFFQAFDWMEVLATVLLLLYNGERGKGNAKFFYWFYPLHVYVLYGLSVIIYMLVQ